MLIVWGFKTLFKKIEDVQFHCPHCKADRAGTRRLARRWFTLFWAPVIPLKTQGEVIRCETCKKLYDVCVLDAPTSEQLIEWLQFATRAGVVALMGVDVPGDASRDAAVSAVVSTGLDYSSDHLFEDVANAGGQHLDAWLRHLADALSVHGKEQFLTKMASVAAADGPISSAERAQLSAMGAALAMSVNHVTGVLSAVSAATGS